MGGAAERDFDTPLTTAPQTRPNIPFKQRHRLSDCLKIAVTPRRYRILSNATAGL